MISVNIMYSFIWSQLQKTYHWRLRPGTPHTDMLGYDDKLEHLKFCKEKVCLLYIEIKNMLIRLGMYGSDKCVLTHCVAHIVEKTCLLGL